MSTINDVWCWRLRLRGDEEVGALLPLLDSDKERERVLKKWRPADQLQSAAGALLARYVASVLGSCSTKDIAWTRGGAGERPRVAAGAIPLPDVNISHDDGLVVAAASSTGTVGVDVLSLTRARDTLLAGPSALHAVAAAVGAREWAAVQAAAEADPMQQAHMFAAAWTRMEARTKLTGAGLSGAAAAVEEATGSDGSVRVLLHTVTLPQLLAAFTAGSDASSNSAATKTKTAAEVAAEVYGSSFVLDGTHTVAVAWSSR